MYKCIQHCIGRLEGASASTHQHWGCFSLPWCSSYYFLCPSSSPTIIPHLSLFCGCAFLSFLFFSESRHVRVIATALEKVQDWMHVGFWKVEVHPKRICVDGAAMIQYIYL